MNQEKETYHTAQDALKEEIINRLQEQHNPLLLKRIKRLLDEADTLEQLSEIPAIQKLLKEEEEEDHEIRRQQQISQNTSLERYDARAAGPMFYLGALSLLLISALVTAMTEEDLSPLFSSLVPWLGGLTGFVYLFFVADVALLFYFRQRSSQIMCRQEKYFRLLSLLFPPLRIGSRDIVSGQYIWIPAWHWCKVNEGLFLEVKRRFIFPMIGIALLIVPVLIIEWKFLNDVREEFPTLEVDLILESVQTFIWSAFTFEFILMISISNKKIEYVKKNWIDLLIILLPFASFLRTLRFSQIARLKYATRSFKLRGVITKARQGLIFIDFLQRILRLRPESELKRLHRSLRENQRNREELEKKMLETADLMRKNKLKKKE